MTMDSAIRTHVMMGLMNPKMISQKCFMGLLPQVQISNRPWSSAYLMVSNEESLKVANHKAFSALQAVSPVQYPENPNKPSRCFKDLDVSVRSEEDMAIKIRVNVASAMTQSIFEEVFSKLVVAAQPIPGFRRVKGGKTPDIPKDVLLHIIGPSKVNSQSIKKIINCTVAEYVQKEGLKVSKDLKVEQSYEELEAAFEPGKEFFFDAIVHLQ